MTVFRLELRHSAFRISRLLLKCLLFRRTTYGDIAMSSPRHLVFTYGTLKKGFNNEPMLEDQNYLGKAVITDSLYRLYAVSDGPYPYPALIPDNEKGYPVYGELYEVGDLCLKYLDKLEGVAVELYKRIFVKVALTDGRLLNDVLAYQFCRP